MDKQSPLDAEQAVEISYRPALSTHLSSVAVVGSFNNWDKTKHPLSESKGGEWTGTFPLKPGVYSCLFVVNEDKWIPIPGLPTKNDLNGNVNSLLTVEPALFKNRTGITYAALLHDPTRVFTVRRSSHEFGLKLRTRKGDARAIRILLEDGNSATMRRIGGDALFDQWYGLVTLAQLEVRYAFEIRGESETARYPREWFEQNFAKIPLPSPQNWVKDAIFYQIFPDRFATEDADRTMWGAIPAQKGWAGGNLAGITRHLSHLKELGVNAIYLNPIFPAGSYHAYDTDDYLDIEPHFGSLSDFRELVKQSHATGIRIMLDGVYNHTSVNHPFFKDLIKNEARSEYSKWYFPLSFPISTKEGQQTYVGWAGVHRMPKLNTGNPAVQEFVGRVGQFWVGEMGADAWRLDVADEVDPECWRKFRIAVRSANPEAYIVGEAWHDPAPWVQGDQHDATMNYQWREAVLQFFGNRTLTARQFDARLRDLRELIPEEVTSVQYNLLGSHDTPRLLTLMGGDKARMAQAVVFQFLYPGVPSIYYGDEIGMVGWHDPDCRRGMIWSRRKWDMSVFKLYRKMISLRSRSEAVRRGSYRTVAAESRPGLFVFERQLGRQRVRAAFNVGNHPIELPDAPGFRALDLSPKSGDLQPGAFRILVRSR
ncbi:MAG: alpha amylase N-terminal ig-like domain-containing protein [Chthonomonas sp.]|nr:alpha amylase N-terminal ig-like domain-containing protein [Chthonomonas sp.]